MTKNCKITQNQYLICVARINGAYICYNCGVLNGYSQAAEYINFNENKYKIMKKSVYHRKYHLTNSINKTCDTTDLYISTGNLIPFLK